MCFATLLSLQFTSPDCRTVFPLQLLPRFCRSSRPRLTPWACVPTVLSYVSTGISTCCPSDTCLHLSLGPDLPGADQLYPGILGYSAKRIPTSFSLLIPAFSLPYCPRLLTVPLHPVCHAPLPDHFRDLRGFGGVFQPRTFSAQDLSTSELLRTL